MARHPLLGIEAEEMQSSLDERLVAATFTAASLRVGKHGSNLSVHQQVMDKESTHTGVLLSPKNEESPAICDQMVEPGGHRAK